MTQRPVPLDRGFTLDRFQVEAIEAIDAGRSVLVAAPTGSGKTVVAEHAVARALAAGRKAFYTTPIKALSNQKFHDLVTIQGAPQVGLLTGDNVVNADAPLIVMTTEVLRNMIYAASPALTGLAVVVLDEVHYLQDPYRGPVWEEVIVHAPPDVRLVCLSATVSNAAEVAEWIGAVRGPTSVVVEERRPVELVNLYAAHDRATRQLNVLPTLVDGHPNPAGERLDVDALRSDRKARGRPRRRWATPRRAELVDHLAEQDLLPAIVFVFSRKGCEEAAGQLLDAGVRLTTPAERRQIRAIAGDHVSALDDRDLDVLGHHRWLSSLEHGVAAHHAGMVPPFKEAVEACFVQGLVKVVFATETLALGINMPARSVVIEALTKFTGEQHEALTPAEYTQLTGRAGRRGIDELGRAFVPWSPFVNFDQVAALAMSRQFALTSAFRTTYNMAANLVRRYDRDDAHRLLNRSFAQFQADRSVLKLERRRDDRAAGVAALESAARCGRGDVEEYRALVRSEERGRRAASGRSAVADGLIRTRPGDVLVLDGDRVAVLSKAHRGGGRVRLQVVGTNGRTRSLGASDFDEPPARVATVALPVPFTPGNREFQREVVRQLRDVPVARHARDEPRRSRKRPPTDHSHPATGRAEDHPVAACPDRREHLRAAGQLERVRRELADLDQRIGSSSGSVARRFDAVLALLGERGMVDGWALTAAGRLLVRVYHESDLLITEAIYGGLLDRLGPEMLAGIVSCLTYEHRSKVPPPPPWFPTRDVRERFDQLATLARDLQAAERRHRLPETRVPDPTFLPLALAWASGTALDDLLDDEDLSGGDFVRNVRQLIDLLRQLADAAPVASTRAAARMAAGQLLHGVVAASSVLSDPGDDIGPDELQLDDIDPDADTGGEDDDEGSAR